MPRAALGGALQAKRDSGELPYVFMAGVALGGALQVKRDSGESPYLFTPELRFGKPCKRSETRGSLELGGCSGDSDSVFVCW